MATITSTPKVNLGLGADSFQGSYGFISSWGPQRYAALGIMVSDGHGNVFGVQRLNVGTGQFLPADFSGTYAFQPDGLAEFRFSFSVPGPTGPQTVEAVFYFVPFRVEQRGGSRLVTELRGVDQSPAVDLVTGQPLQPPALGESLLKRLF
jgi:hypothetical protein